MRSVLFLSIPVISLLSLSPLVTRAGTRSAVKGVIAAAKGKAGRDARAEEKRWKGIDKVLKKIAGSPELIQTTELLPKGRLVLAKSSVKSGHRARPQENDLYYRLEINAKHGLVLSEWRTEPTVEDVRRFQWTRGSVMRVTPVAPPPEEASPETMTPEMMFQKARYDLYKNDLMKAFPGLTGKKIENQLLLAAARLKMK